MQISPRGHNAAFNTRGVPVRPDGTFLIPNVPAGDYYVSAIWGRGGGPNAVREGGFVPITVNGDEVSVTIQTNTGATVSGRVVLEGTPPAQAGAPGSAGRPGQVRVMARPTSEQYAAGFSGGEQSPTSGAVRPDGTFTLSGLRGPLQFTAMGGRAALKEIRRGATDISGQPVELLGTERIDDLVVVMTYDTGGIEGVIEDEGDKPISDAAALIVPDDPDKWNAGSPFVRIARVSPSSPGGTPFTAATPGVTTTTAPASVVRYRRKRLPVGTASPGALPGGGVRRRRDALPARPRHRRTAAGIRHQRDGGGGPDSHREGQGDQVEQPRGKPEAGGREPL